MDPVGSTVGIITFGFTVFRQLESLREFINAAPNQLQALQDSCTATTLLLRRAEQIYERMPDLDQSTATLRIEQLDQLWSNVDRYLKDIDAILKKLSGSISGNGKGRVRRVAIRLRKWLFKPNEVENVAKRLSILQLSLLMMVNFTNS